MRKTLAVALLLLTLTFFAGAQQFAPHQYWASDFANWSVPGGGPNSFSFLPSQCVFSAPGVGIFQPFSKTPAATYAPVYIFDTSTSANSESVTPSSVTLNGTACTLTMAPSNTHYSFQLQSGTAGLQEAIDSIYANQVSAAAIFLDKGWYAKVSAIGGSAPSIIASASGSANIAVVDETTSPFTYYVWNGSKYVAAAGVTGGTAVPTAAAGAGAGTGPTIADFGNGSTVLVNLTAGTSTATGTIFTLTYANSGASSSSFAYAPSCSIISVGSNVPAGTLSVSSAYASSHATITASIATSALTASTAYQFRVTCQ